MFDDVGAALRDGPSPVFTFVPELLGFLVISLIGWSIAKALRESVNLLLERVGFDRAVERGGIGRAVARSRRDASDLVAILVYYAGLLITLQLAFGAFGLNPISGLVASTVSFLPPPAVAIVIVVVAAVLAAAVRELVSAAMGGSSYGRVVADIAPAFVIGLGVIAALGQIGIATTVTLPVLVAVPAASRTATRTDHSDGLVDGADRGARAVRHPMGARMPPVPTSGADPSAPPQPPSEKKGVTAWVKIRGGPPS